MKRIRKPKTGYKARRYGQGQNMVTPRRYGSTKAFKPDLVKIDPEVRAFIAERAQGSSFSAAIEKLAADVKKFESLILGPAI